MPNFNYWDWQELNYLLGADGSILVAPGVFPCEGSIVTFNPSCRIERIIFQCRSNQKQMGPVRAHQSRLSLIPAGTGLEALGGEILLKWRISHGKLGDLAGVAVNEVARLGHIFKSFIWKREQRSKEFHIPPHFEL